MDNTKIVISSITYLKLQLHKLIDSFDQLSDKSKQDIVHEIMQLEASLHLISKYFLESKEQGQQQVLRVKSGVVSYIEDNNQINIKIIKTPKKL